MARIQLVIERDADECVVKIAGTAYTFKRDDKGRLVTDITNTDHLKWVSDPYHYGSFKVLPAAEEVPVEKAAIVDEVVEEVVEQAPAVPSKKGRHK